MDGRFTYIYSHKNQPNVGKYVPYTHQTLQVAKI